MKYFFSTIIILLLAFVSCKEPTNGENPFVKEEIQLVQEPLQDNTKTDNLGAELFNLKTEQLSVGEYLVLLIKKKDSLSNLLITIDETTKNINSKKLDKGIEGVTNKLNELKGEKENLLEQISLQKKEADLADQKIGLLENEKKVYQDQRQALFDKGAEPSAFTNVDSLLLSINNAISNQKRVVKNVNRSIDDKEEQVVEIDISRKSLSTKIRSNYSAQEIYTEFAKEEKTRINNQIEVLNGELEKYSDESSQLKMKIEALNSNLIQKNQEALNKQEAQEKIIAEQENGIQKDKNKKWAGIIIVSVAFLMFLLYYIGRKKNKN